MGFFKKSQKGILKNTDAKKTATLSIDFLIGGLIYLIFLLCPIFFTGFVSQGLGFEKMMLFYFLVLAGIVIWIIKGIIQGELILKRTPLDIPIITTLVLFGISTILSVSNKDSLLGSYGNPGKGYLALIIFVLFYYFLANNLNAKRIKGIFISLLLSSSLMTFYAIMQLFGKYLLPLGFTEQKSFNPVGSLSSLTMYLVAILPFLVVAFTQVKEIFPKIKKGSVFIFKMISLLAVFGVLMTLVILNGFTFWPVAVVGVVIVLMFLMSKIIKAENSSLTLPLLVFVTLIIFLVMGDFNFGKFDLPSEITLSRKASFDIAKSSLRENPIFGSGPSTFYYTFSKFKSIDFNASPLWNIRFESASGALFELVATVGILGTVSVTILGLIALSIVFITLVKNKESEISSILLAAFASFVVISLNALLFSQDASLILLTVMLSAFTVTAALFVYPEKLSALKLSFRSSAKYALALAAIFLFVSSGVVVMFTMGIKMYLADKYAKDSLLVNGAKQKIELLNKAVTLAPYQDAYYLSMANQYMALANQAASNNDDQTVIGQNLSKAIENGRKAVEISPNKAANNESLALIYENASFYTRGALEWAENLYKTLSELDPLNPIPNLRMALINMARANTETEQSEINYYVGEAIKRYDEAVTKKPNLAAAYYGKAIAQEKLGNTDASIEELKRANLSAGNNVDYQFELGRLLFNRGVAQPNLTQEASRQITENDITPEGEENIEGEEGQTENEEELSIQPTQKSNGAVITRNKDINEAERIFKNILSTNPNHVNARYSLAVLYLKIGESNNVRKEVRELLGIVKDEKTISAIKEQFRGFY